MEAQERDRRGVERAAVVAGEEDAGCRARAALGPAVHERLETIHHAERRPPRQVRLGDHRALVRRPVEVPHEVVAQAGDVLGDEPHRVLERERDVTAEAMGLAAHGLHHARAVGEEPRGVETLRPVGRGEGPPRVAPAVVEHDDLAAHGRDGRRGAGLLQHRPGVAHA